VFSEISKNIFGGNKQEGSMKDTESPMVSIIVITFNSSKYVLETLESAKAQTYQNTELIVSDDCSTDNTVEICQKWMDENKNRFYRAEILTTKSNSGVSANCNRGLKAANGKWLKIIAGDDILFPDCIESNIKFLQQSNEKILFLFSRYKFLVGTEFVDDHPRTSYFNKNENKYNGSARHQFFSLIKEVFVCAPTGFLNKEALLKLDGFDESFPDMEDYPMWLKATSNGNKLFFNPVETVIYRFHDLSISEQVYEKFVYLNIKAINKYFKLKYRILFPLNYIDFRLDYFNRKRVIERKSSYGKLTNLINPLAILRFIKRKVEKNNPKIFIHRPFS
jgi:glycosyltransferase involved in cell wall biosynthesis